MSVRLEGRKNPYNPKDSDPVECHARGIKTTWGELSAIGRIAVEEGLDTIEELDCLLLRKD